MKNQHTITPDEFERIERYLTQSMDENEANLFTHELNTDIVLKEKVAEVRLLLIAISEESLKVNLDRYHGNIEEKSKPVRNDAPVVSMKRRWLVAATILAMLATSVWVFLNQSNNYGKLYSRFYLPDPGLPTYMSSSADYNFDKGMVAYKDKDYKQAITEWMPLLRAQPANDTLNYFVGAVFQAMDENEKAIPKLQLVASDTTSVFNKDACWYLGLSYLKTGLSDSAVIYIERSGNTDAPQILQALNNE